MRTPLAEIPLRAERDAVLARQRARAAAEALGFDAQDQSRVATAVSEIARNALVHGRGGAVSLNVLTLTRRAQLEVRVVDRGPGFDEVSALAAGGMGLAGARRLMDDLVVERHAEGGACVRMFKQLPREARLPSSAALRSLAARLRLPVDPAQEAAAQNRELLSALAALRDRNEELSRVNRELEDTNRGVVALYAELDQRAAALERASVSKNRFFSGVSHELRTPLQSIDALARLLLEEADGPLTAEQRKQVQYIVGATGTLREMVDDLLDLARIEAGHASVRIEPFTLADLFGALRGMLRPLAAEREVALVFEPPPPVSLVSDEAKMAQVLRNFVSNALKFTERGEVRVSARLVGAAEEEIEISVHDSGIGIAPADQAVIFEEFVQLDSARGRRARGSGLGLALCRHLADLLGGRVRVASEPGVGSTFYLRCPLRLAASAADARATPC